VIVRAATLHGRRVSLRPYALGFSDDELARLREWACDPDVLLLAGGSPLDMSYERFRRVFRAQLPRRNTEREQQFAILDERGVMIGRTGLFWMGPGLERAELGIVIGEQDCWGRGYGRDAVGTLVDFGFEALALRTITLYTFPENRRAQRAFAAVGFRRVGEKDRFSLERGTHTEIEMVIRPEDRATIVAG
jgi:RimJ/RimL family protein N-acetyltransferase